MSSADYAEESRASPGRQSGHGFTVEYDAEKFDLVEANLLNSKGAATPLFTVISDEPGPLLDEAANLRGYGFILDEPLSRNFPNPFNSKTEDESFELAQNFPNPFNPNTVIRYALPRSCQVQLQICNVLGQVVRTLVDEKQKPGRYARVGREERERTGFSKRDLLL